MVVIKYLFLAFFLLLPSLSFAGYVAVEPLSDWTLNAGSWEITIGNLPGISYPNTVAHKPFCVQNQYDLCPSGPGTNGVTNSSSVVTLGFSTSTNATSSTYFYTIAPFNPGSSFNDCTSKDCYFFSYNWNNDSKTVTPTPAVLNQSRIISFTPENASLASTTQTFTAQIESSTPTLTQLCFYILPVSNFQSFNPTKLCEPVLSTGIVDFSTSTTLINDSSFLYRVEIYTTSTSTPYQVSENRYFNTGALPWSPAVDFYNNGTTTSLTPDEFCSTVPDTLGMQSLCKIAMTILMFPGQAFTSAIASATGALQSIPPISWYYQIRIALTEVEYQSETQQGITLNTGFDTEVEMLTETQIDEYTGGNLSNLRLLTTTFIWILFVLYLIHRIKSIFT